MKYIVKPTEKTTLGYCFGCGTQKFNECDPQSPKPGCTEYTCGKYNS